MALWDEEWHRRLQQVIESLPGRPVAEQSAIRRELSRDPVAFALIYLSKHLRSKETGGRVSFSEVHYEWARRALSWRDPVTEPMTDRHAEIAPRSTGKSSWWYLFIPLWAAAHGHVRFVVALAHSATQSVLHLDTFKKELKNNALLRADFPELCNPVSNQQDMLQTRAGFTFAARGMDCASLGLKVDEARPDTIILDDVEPDESSYSAYLVQKRLTTMTDAVLALNIYARVVLVGTVTMPGSIVHQLVKAGKGEEHPEWIDDEKFQVHHYRPIAVNDDGTERSIWPEKWPLAWLQSRRHTREYAKNYDNDPQGHDGGYWTTETFEYGTVEAVTRRVLVIDPSVTSRDRSDRTGIAIVGYSPSEDRVVVEHAEGVRLVGDPLRAHLHNLIRGHPGTIHGIVIEVNQGGDLWRTILGPLGLKIVTTWHGSSKEVRFSQALDWYQKPVPAVVHAGKFPMLEEEMVGFPVHAHDDIADAVCTGVLWFLEPRETQAAPRASTARYK